MKCNNLKLYRKIKSYVKFALKIANREIYDSSKSTGYSEFNSFPFFLIEGQLINSREYDACIKALKDDISVVSHLDVMVGIHIRRNRSPTLENLMFSLPMMGAYKNSCIFNEEHFNREYIEFERLFYEEELNYEVIVPLHGVTIKKLFKLEPDLEFCQVNQCDLSSLLKKESVTQHLEVERYLWAIKTAYKLPKVVGDGKQSDFEESRKNAACRERVNDKIEKVLMCLRVFGITNIYPTSIIHRTKPWLFHDVQQFPVRYFPSFQFQVDYGSFGEDLIKFWKVFSSEKVSNRKFILIAAKRFSYAHERHHWEDKIIDLLIAAEAVLLSDGNKGELNYRLSLRAALLIGQDFESRKVVFDDLKLAYDLRSGLVHGGDAKSALKNIKKNEVSTFGDENKINTFVFRIQEYIRIIIVKMIYKAYKSNEGNGLVDWEGLIFEEKVNTGA
jgi:hypothetical protein